MILKKYILYPVIIVLLASCSAKLDVQLPYAGDRLIVFCNLDPTEPVELFLNRTYPPTGKFIVDTTYLSTVSAELYEDGKVVDIFARKAEQRYMLRTDYRVKEGKTYQLRARAKGMPELVSNSIIVPKKLQIDEVKVLGKTNPYFSGSNYNTFKLSVKLTEQGTDRNYYSVGMWGSADKNTFLYNNFYPLGKISDIRDDCSYSAREECFFNKLCTLSQQKTHEFSFTEEGSDGKGGGTIKVKKVKVFVRSMPDERYKYFVEYVRDQDFTQAFIPAKPRLSNVKNGFGAVVTSNTAFVEFPFPKQ